MDNKQRIIDKITRCLALSKSSNENEAATALRQAHAMMAKYDITIGDIELSDIKQKHSESRLARRPPIHLAVLGNMIARIFGCSVYIDTDIENRKSMYCFVGLDMHVEIASYAYDSLFRQLKQARLNYMKIELNRVRLAKNKAARADAFCLGWVSTVKRLIENIAPLDTDFDLIERYMNNELQLVSLSPANRVKNSKARSSTNDYFNGKMAGQNAQLHHAMHNEANKSLQIGIC